MLEITDVRRVSCVCGFGGACRAVDTFLVVNSTVEDCRKGSASKTHKESNGFQFVRSGPLQVSPGCKVVANNGGC